MLACPSAAHEPRKPIFSLSYNILQTAAFVVAKEIFVKKRLLIIPLHFDAQIELNDELAMSFGFVYRYEDYGVTGPSHSNKRIRPTYIWSNYHELFLLAGPRYSLSQSGLEGFYLSLRAGPGFGLSPAYFSLSALLQPDYGYSYNFGTPGFTLSLGLGILFNLPFYESEDFAVPWKEKYQRFGIIQVLSHQATPILSLGLGFNI